MTMKSLKTAGALTSAKTIEALAAEHPQRRKHRI